MRTYLLENDLPEIEAYEIAKDAITKPVLTCFGRLDEAISIGPAEEYVIEAKCCGKLGL